MGQIPSPLPSNMQLIRLNNCKSCSFPLTPETNAASFDLRHRFSLRSYTQPVCILSIYADSSFLSPSIRAVLLTTCATADWLAQLWPQRKVKRAISCFRGSLVGSEELFRGGRGLAECQHRPLFHPLHHSCPRPVPSASPLWSNANVCRQGTR